MLLDGVSTFKTVKSCYQIVFVDQWSPYIGAICLVVAIAVLLASGMYWGVFSGIKLWGDHFNQIIGLAPALGIKQALDDVFMHRVSLLNITLLAGAFCAALISRQFRINRPPPLEYVWAIVGGCLMGLGATLAGGCTVGGFFMPLIFLSPAGWVMLIGLTIGAIIGMKCLLWTLSHISCGMTAPTVKPAKFTRWYAMAGLVIMILIAAWAIIWWSSNNEMKSMRAYMIPIGFAIGFIIHRSRFCFARVIREPFMTGEGEMTRAMMLAIALGTPVAAIMFSQDSIDPYIAIPARFWIGSLIGGIVFGTGMVFAGGCASGSLWRAAEGHLKLIVALVFFAWSGSVASALLGRAGLTTVNYDFDYMEGVAEITSLGLQVYLPDLFRPDVLSGWVWPLVMTYCVLVFWYLLVRYNERTGRLLAF